MAPGGDPRMLSDELREVPLSSTAGAALLRLSLAGRAGGVVLFALAVRSSTHGAGSGRVRLWIGAAALLGPALSVFKD